MINRKTKVNTNKEGFRFKKNKYFFQEKLARLQHWLKLDIDWVVEKFNTREPEFY